MVEQSFVSSAHKSSNNTLWYILAGVVGLAVILGGGVWWYANNLIEEPTPTATPRPVVKTPTPASPSPSPAIAPVGINLVGESKSITFPKAGRVYMYYYFILGKGSGDPYIIDLVTSKVNVSVETPGGAPKSPAKMHVIDTGLDVTAGEVVAIQPYDFGDFDRPSAGWIKPTDSTSCGAPGHVTAIPDILSWAKSTITATGEPIVSEQCWSDWENGSSDIDYNDFLIMFTYGKAATSPSPTAVASAIPSPSPSPSAKASVAASIAPSASPSPITVASPSVASPTPRAAMPDTSEGVPVTGVIEDTIRGIGVGAGLLLLGLLLL